MEERVLFVEDEEATCATIGRYLRNEGCSCLTAKSGEESLHYFYRDKFSMITSGIHMPEMNGIDLLKQAKRLNPHTMVIIITTYLKIPAVDRETVQSGACDLISEPADLDLLAFSVERGFEKKRLEEEFETYHAYLEGFVDAKTTEFQPALLILWSFSFRSTQRPF